MFNSEQNSNLDNEPTHYFSQTKNSSSAITYAFTENGKFLVYTNWKVSSITAEHTVLIPYWRVNDSDSTAFNSGVIYLVDAKVGDTIKLNTSNNVQSIQIIKL